PATTPRATSRPRRSAPTAGSPTTPVTPTTTRSTPPATTPTRARPSTRRRDRKSVVQGNRGAPAASCTTARTRRAASARWAGRRAGRDDQLLGVRARRRDLREAGGGAADEGGAGGRRLHLGRLHDLGGRHLPLDRPLHR